jgi:hypothetical protein
MARWAEKGLEFHVRRAIAFSFDSKTEAGFTRLYLKYETPKDNPASGSNMRWPNYSQQTRLDQTYWERNLEGKNYGSAYGPGQGWRKLDQVQRNDQLLLVTDANCDTEGIILSIVTWTDDAIEARFMCRAHVTPRSQFKIKKPDPAQWQNRPGSLGPGSENGRILAPRNIANLALRTGSSGNNQTDGIGPLEEGGPTDRTGLPGERGARVIGRDRKERKKAKKASNGSQAPDDEFKEWKKKNDPAHGIVAPVAYGIQDCKIILVE